MDCQQRITFFSIIRSLTNVEMSQNWRVSVNWYDLMLRYLFQTRAISLSELYYRSFYSGHPPRKLHACYCMEFHLALTVYVRHFRFVQRGFIFGSDASRKPFALSFQLVPCTFCVHMRRVTVRDFVEIISRSMDVRQRTFIPPQQLPLSLTQRLRIKI